VRIGTLAQVSALYTDQPPPPPIAALIGTLGIELHVADSGPASGAP
jgi:DeoR family glycerol-3-phosphate regulon repressor